MAVWDPNEIVGGLDRETLDRARLLLWKGHCSVHTRFTVKQIENVRRQHPGVRVIVHPECTWDVVQAADDNGSTEYIMRKVRESAPGTTWAIGTEIHLVNRLANEVAPEKTVVTLDQFGCLCSTMFRVSPNHLLWILEGLTEGVVHNRIVGSGQHEEVGESGARPDAQHLRLSPLGAIECRGSYGISRRCRLRKRPLRLTSRRRAAVSRWPSLAASACSIMARSSCSTPACSG